MQLERLTFQKGHNDSDEDVALPIGLLGFRKIFEICRHTVPLVENKMLLDISALKSSFAWIRLGCNVLPFSLLRSARDQPKSSAFNFP